MRYSRYSLAAVGVVAAIVAPALPHSALAEGPHSSAFWAGVGLKEDVLAAYAGGVWAANGQLDETGFLFRGQVLFVNYEFDTALAASGEADVDLYRGNALVGYQLAGETATASLFAGIDLQDRDFDPKAADSGLLDDEVGFMVATRLATKGPTMFPASLEANYSTANDSYWARGRVGYRIDQFTIGPELGVLGDDGFDAVRYGGHAAVNFGDIILQFNAGYNDADSNAGSSGGGDGAYGNATVVFLF